jgi:hypothetical protein
MRGILSKMQRSKISNIPRQELQFIVDSVCAKREILAKLGYSKKSSGAYQQLKRKIEEQCISLDKLEENKRNKQRLSKKRKPVEEIFVAGIFINNDVLKKRLVNDGYLEYVCNLCGNCGEWQGMKLTLQLDHINGDNKDNRLKNLRFLCPNCHSQTDTFCGMKKPKNKCSECDKNIRRESKKCRECSIDSKRKFKLTREQLEDDIKNKSLRQIASEQGVSSTTVRKWAIKWKLGRYK